MKIFFPVLVALVLATPALALTQDEAAAGTPGQASAAEHAATPAAAVKPARKKLRFRDRGPTCMCAGGLTEKDISAGRAGSSEQQTLQPPTQSNGPQP